MDATAGVFTTHKVQSLLDCGINANVKNRRDLVTALTDQGQSISIHGVEAWFRHVDSNYNLPRDSLCDTHRSYQIPLARWPALIEVFDLEVGQLDDTDENFRRWCFVHRVHHDERAAEAPRLVGRDAELRELTAAFSDSAERANSLFLVQGSPGVGKSSLLNAAMWELERRGGFVLGCACVERADTALLPILDLIDAHGDAIHRANAEASATLDEMLRQSSSGDGLLLRLKRALLDLAGRQTLVLIVDDAHWADESTLRFLAQLVRGRAPQRAFVLLAARPHGDESQWADGLRTLASGATTLRLREFDRTQSAAFVTDRLGSACGGAFLRWIWDRTLGNPFYLEQMLDHLSRSGHLDPTRVPPKDTDVPQSIVTAISARVGRLASGTQQLLGLASVFGASFRIAELQYVHGELRTRQVIAHLEEAELAGLIAYDRDSFRFTHPLTRQTIYDSLADTRRAHFHATIGQRLRDSDETTPLKSLEVANHMLRGRMFVEWQVLADVCVEATEVSQRLEAWDQVIRFAMAALDTDDAYLDAEVRRRMERLAGVGLHQMGDPRGAITYLQRAVDAHERAGNLIEASRAQADICRIRSNFGISSERQSHDIESLVRAIPVLREVDVPLAAWVLDTIAMHCYSEQDMERAERHIGEALNLLKSVEPCRELSLVLIAAGVLGLAGAEPVTACRYFVRAEATARSVGDKGEIARSLQRLAIAQLTLGRFEELRTTMESLRSMEDDVTETGEHALGLAAELTALTVRGRTREAEAVYAEARTLLDRKGYLPAVPLIHGAYAANLALSGDCDGARDVLEDVPRWQHRGENPTGGRSYDTLRGQLSILVDEMQRPGAAQGIPDSLLLRPPGEGRYMGNVSSFAIGLEMAIRRGHTGQIRLAMPVIAEAARRGAAITPVWPTVCVLQLARAANALGNRAAARAYLPIAYDQVRRMESPRLLQDVTALARNLGVRPLPASV